MTEEKLQEFAKAYCVYPVYINSERTNAEGRRISKEEGCT